MADDSIEIHGIRGSQRCQTGYFRRDQATAESEKLEAEKGWTMPVFAWDKPNSQTDGAKKYYCLSIAEFVDLLRTMDRTQWCFYEVTIPHRPCRIYLDVEAQLDINPGFDGNEMRRKILDEFTRWLASQISPEFGDPDRFSWRVLDASSAQKWSHHMIGVGLAMTNPFHVGATVRRFERYITETYGKDSCWFVNTTHKLHEETIKTFVVDIGVYTEYRVYRMAYQHKRGSNRDLVPHPDFLLGSGSRSEIGFGISLLLDTMVQPPRLGVTCAGRIHSCMEADGSQPRSMVCVSGERRIKTKTDGSTRIQSGSGSANPCPSAIYQLLHSVVQRERNAQLESIFKAKMYPTRMMVMIPSMDTYCHIKKDAHHSHLENRSADQQKAQTYYCFHLVSKTYTQKCLSSLCAARYEKDAKIRAQSTWKFPEYAIQQLREIMDGDSGSDIRECGFVYASDIRHVLSLGKGGMDE
jgi:hypothetical protein